MGRFASILLVVLVLGIALRACFFARDIEAEVLPPAGELSSLQTPTRPQAQPLFDGRSLEAFELVGDARFSLAEGCIVGETGSGKANSFLLTRASYHDFELELELKLEAPGNSGIQVRSELVKKSDSQAAFVRGYQIEVDPSERAWSGGLYEERGRGWLADLKDKPEARKAFRANDWNHYRIRCEGAHFIVHVNGVLTTDTVDGRSPSGKIALQVHSGPPMKILWRQLQITPLGAHQWEPLALGAEAELARDLSLRLRRSSNAMAPGRLRLRAGAKGALPPQQQGPVTWDAQGLVLDLAHESLHKDGKLWEELEVHCFGSRLVLVRDGLRCFDATLLDIPTGNKGVLESGAGLECWSLKRAP